MSANSERFGATLERLAPLLVVIVIVVVGYMWFIQPGVAQFLSGRDQAATLENRVRTLQTQVARESELPPVDQQAGLAEVERRVSTDDKVADVVERLARTALEGAPKGQIKGLLIETGSPTQGPSGFGAARGTAAGPSLAQSDPRLALFPYRIVQTPVTVTFESSFAAIAAFAWRLRDMPTMVEVHSMTLTRGLPLMKAQFVLRVFQRGTATAPVPAPAPDGTPAGPAPPRVAQLAVTEG